jgi:ferredoxin
MGQPVTRWHVAVDKGTCIGSAICVGTAPGRFELDAQQRSGPVEAISLVDADTGEPVDLD